MLDRIWASDNAHLSVGSSVCLFAFVFVYSIYSLLPFLFCYLLVSSVPVLLVVHTQSLWRLRKSSLVCALGGILYNYPYARAPSGFLRVVRHLFLSALSSTMTARSQRARCLTTGTSEERALREYWVSETRHSSAVQDVLVIGCDVQEGGSKLVW